MCLWLTRESVATLDDLFLEQGQHFWTLSCISILHPWYIITHPRNRYVSSAQRGPGNKWSWPLESEKWSIISFRFPRLETHTRYSRKWLAFQFKGTSWHRHFKQIEKVQPLKTSTIQPYREENFECRFERVDITNYAVMTPSNWRFWRLNSSLIC